MFKGVKNTTSKSLETLHQEQWYEYYQILVKTKKVNGKTKSKAFKTFYNNFCLNVFTKNLKLIK
mgnify:CR=1 FL=1